MTSMKEYNKPQVTKLGDAIEMTLRRYWYGYWRDSKYYRAYYFRYWYHK
jgi:hypothetical protein